MQVIASMDVCRRHRRAEHDYRGGASAFIAFETSEYFRAIHSWQIQVENDDMGRSFAYPLVLAKSILKSVFAFVKDAQIAREPALFQGLLKQSNIGGTD
jgi:hypothetical protein